MSRLSFSWADAKRSSHLLLFSANISDAGSAPSVGSLVVAEILAGLIAAVAQRAGEGQVVGHDHDPDDDDDDDEEDDEAAEDADDEAEEEEEDDKAEEEAEGGGEGEGEEAEEAEAVEEEAPVPPPRRSGRTTHPPARFTP